MPISPKGFQPLILSCAVALAVSQQAGAVEFSYGEVEGTFNSQLSIGTSWSLENASPDTIAIANGGTSYSSASDDGKQNFKKGETFSEIFKGVHELTLNYQDYGAFLRGKYWYDRRLKKDDVLHGHGPTGYGDTRTSKKLDDSNFHNLAKFSGAEMLDAYVFGSFELGEQLLDLRLGRQVVSWGESTFIRNGINVINPVDVSAFRRPGAEIKEGLMPVNMIFGNLAVTDNLSLEAFYQLEWKKTVLDGCGTFFAGGDLVGNGCNYATIGGGNPYFSDGVASNSEIGSGLGPGNASGSDQARLIRLDDKKAKNSGQFGISARYYASELNDTEFGFYFLNYHNRTPILSGVNAVNDPSAIPGFRGKYFLEYPEDVRLYGLSFSTTAGDYSISGEISHRPNVPVQINPVENLIRALSSGTQGLESGRPFTVPFGGDVHGYDRLAVTQAQVTVVKFVEQVMGASRLTLLGEVGYSHVGSLPSLDERRYGRAFTYGVGERAGCNPTDGSICTKDGFVTSNSWGYKILGALNYNNVFAGVNLTPRAVYSHDVKGNSATGTFLEDRQALTLGLNAEYLNKYTASVSATKFWGGEYNTAKDRDFASISLGMSF